MRIIFWEPRAPNSKIRGCL